MSGKNINTRFYTARDIEKYLAGELSAPEMHALEKAALEDPLLADALEGIENNRLLHGETSFQTGLGELKQRLENKIIEKNRRRIPILLRSRWRVAAVIILLCGLAAGSYRYLFSEKRRQVLARSERAVAVSDSTGSVATVPANPPVPANSANPVNPANPAVTANQTAPAAPAIPANPGKTNSQADLAGHPSPVNPATSDKSHRTARERFLKSSPPSAVTAGNSLSLKSKENNILSKDSLSPTPSGAPAAGSALEGKVAGIAVRKGSVSFPDNLSFLSGKVTDMNNKPLSSARVTLKGHDITTATDSNGQFRLKLTVRDTLVDLTVNSIGYAPATFGLNMNRASGNILRLQPQTNTLDEVVVTGYDIQRKKTITGSVSSVKSDSMAITGQLAEPAGGWPEYKSWLEKNKKTGITDSTLKGNEIISFRVNMKGELSSFKIEHSLSPAHDKEALRLVKEGPAWKLLKGRKTRVTVVVSF